MPGGLAVAAENTRKHAALGTRLLDLRDLAPAHRLGVEFGNVAARLGDVNAVAEIETLRAKGSGYRLH